MQPAVLKSTSDVPYKSRFLRADFAAEEAFLIRVYAAIRAFARVRIDAGLGFESIGLAGRSKEYGGDMKPWFREVAFRDRSGGVSCLLEKLLA